MKPIRLLAAALLLLAFFVPALAEYQIRIRDNDLNCYTDLQNDVMNILLIGADTWEDVDNVGRSDTMIICSYHLDTGEVRLLSIARDLMVDIPNDGGWNRLNAAHSFGGPNLLMKTINRLMHLNLSRYVSLNIYGLRRIIDAMGGLKLNVTASEALEVNSMISIEFPGEENPTCPCGEVTLNGLQAMTFARIRSLDNDFGRMKRQRTVLLAIAQQASQMDADAQKNFLKACIQNCATNITAADILTFSASALQYGITDMKMLTLPLSGTYIEDTYDGMSVLLAEEKTLAHDARAFLYND